MEQALGNAGPPQLSADTKHAVTLEKSISSPQSMTSPQSLSAPTLSPAQPLPSVPKFQESYITDADRQRAIELLVQQRVIDGKAKKIKKEEPFTYKEVNPVLNAVISDRNSPASPGLVEALLEQGGDVSVARQKSKSLWKKVIRKDQEVRRSDVLAKATQNCKPEVVWVLSRQADDIAKTEALSFAIQQNDTVKARILLDSGADSAEFHTEFLSAVEKNADEMVEIILRATKGPCAPCHAIGLVKAANNGSLRNSLILLEKGANADFENGAALQKAIAAGREDLTNAIAFCANKPSPYSFDIAVGLAYSKLANDAEKQQRMIDICLRGGARGSTTDETLVQACENGQAALIDNLLTHNASVNHRQGVAIQHAITSKQPDLLTTLLRGKPSLSTLATAISITPSLDDPAVAYEITDILLSAGLRGDSVAATLIAVTERRSQSAADSDHLKLIQLLLGKGEANVNYDGGKSIKVAAAGGTTDALKLLLQHSPSTESLYGAFPLAMELGDAAKRLEIVTMLLEAGAKGTIIDEALLASASTGKTGVQLTSVLLKQSSVDYQNGKALCNAINSYCLEQMQALMVGGPSDGTLRAAWVETDALQDDEFQYQAFQILLVAGVDASLKDSSLITAATRGQRGIKVCTLLLQHQASPDYSNGACIVSAAKGLHLDTLNLLASSVTSASVFTTAFDAFSEGDEWLAPKGLEIVHFLLEYGASGPEVDAAFCKAARLYDPDALELLASSVNPEVVNVALVTLTQAGKDWLSPDNSHLWLIHSLLEWGAAGDSVNITLVEALDAYARGLASEDLIDTLLHIGAKADVNFQNGEAVQIAVKYGNAALLEKLASCGATTETLSTAFAEAITTGHDENVLLSLIDVFMNNKGAKPDIKTPPEGYQPPIFACLAAHPQSAKLVKRLAEIECDLEAQIESFTYDDEELEAENVTALAWALCQPENRISSAAIEALIDANGECIFAPWIHYIP
jgi:ankyrin repeat protein